MNKLITVVLILKVCHSAAIAEDGIRACEHSLVLIEAEVNGKSVKLALDTGSRCNVLFRDCVRRLDLKLEKPAPDLLTEIGERKVDVTANYSLSFWGKERRDTQFVVLDGPPGGVKVDGLICWALLRQSVFSIDWASRSTRSHAARPDVTGWDEIVLLKDGNLAIVNGAADSGLVYIDTGSEFGVDLSGSKWSEWKRDNPTSPKTLTAYWTYEGIGSCEQSIARKLRIGRLLFNNVVVQECEPSYSSIPKFCARIGLNALRQFEIVFDGPEHRMFMKRRSPVPFDERYNRLGGVFVPSPANEELTARVVENGPDFSSRYPQWGHSLEH